MENFIIANCSDTGRVRSINEDSMVAFESPNGYVVVVCDGMGGQNAGDVASQLAVEVISEFLTDNTFDTPEEAISNSIIAANRAILIKARNNPEMQGMGSTCVMAIVKDGKVYYGGVGDSRIYYYAAGMLRQVTKDQSYVQTLVDAGEITQTMAENHADKNQITNALGLETMTPPVVGQMPISPEPNSIILLCSDGLSGMINNKAMISTLSAQNLTLDQMAETLVQQANEAGGEDNITVQLIQFPSGAVAMTGAADVKVARPTGRVRKKNNTLLITTICSILLLIACVAGGYWYMHKDDAKQPTQPADPTTEVKKTEKKEEPKDTPKKVKEVKAVEPVKVVSEPVKTSNPTKKTSPVTKKMEQIKKKETVKSKVEEIKGNNAAPRTPAPVINVRKGDFSGEK